MSPMHIFARPRLPLSTFERGETLAEIIILVGFPQLDHVPFTISNTLKNKYITYMNNIYTQYVINKILKIKEYEYYYESSYRKLDWTTRL